MQILNYNPQFNIPTPKRGYRIDIYLERLITFTRIQKNALIACIPQIESTVIKYFNNNNILENLKNTEPTGDNEQTRINFIYSYFFNIYNEFIKELKSIDGLNRFTVYYPFWIETEFINSKVEESFRNQLCHYFDGGPVKYDIYSKPVYLHSIDRVHVFCSVYIKNINSIIFLNYKEIGKLFRGRNVIYDEGFFSIH